MNILIRSDVFYRYSSGSADLRAVEEVLLDHGKHVSPCIHTSE